MPNAMQIARPPPGKSSNAGSVIGAISFHSDDASWRVYRLVTDAVHLIGFLVAKCTEIVGRKVGIPYCYLSPEGLRLSLAGDYSRIGLGAGGNQSRSMLGS